jgi:hypothetical protein
MVVLRPKLAGLIPHLKPSGAVSIVSAILVKLLHCFKRCERNPSPVYTAYEADRSKLHGMLIRRKRFWHFGCYLLSNKYRLPLLNYVVNNYF